MTIIITALDAATTTTNNEDDAIWIIHVLGGFDIWVESARGSEEKDRRLAELRTKMPSADIWAEPVTVHWEDYPEC
jgi:hypothetical protein